MFGRNSPESRFDSPDLPKFGRLQSRIFWFSNTLACNQEITAQDWCGLQLQRSLHLRRMVGTEPTKVSARLFVECNVGGWVFEEGRHPTIRSEGLVLKVRGVQGLSHGELQRPFLLLLWFLLMPQHGDGPTCLRRLSGGLVGVAAIFCGGRRRRRLSVCRSRSSSSLCSGRPGRRPCRRRCGRRSGRRRRCGRRSGRCRCKRRSCKCRSCTLLGGP